MPGVGCVVVAAMSAAIDPAVDDPAGSAVAVVAGDGVMVTVVAAGLFALSHPVRKMMANVAIRDPIAVRCAPHLLIELPFPGGDFLVQSP